MKNVTLKAVFVVCAILASWPGGCRDAFAILTLTMNPSSITFPDQDPDLFPLTTATSTVNIIVTTSGIPGQNYHLSTLSRGDLIAGGSIIPISNISWTAVKTGGDNKVVFFNGTMTKTVPGITVMSGKGSDTTASGVLTFSILNLWSYATGSYNQIVDFTLTAP